MNSTILCWPTLAPLFQAMNRAVWKKKKIHTRSKSSKICLFVMVSRLGEKVILHLVLCYIFFHKQKALSGKRRTLLQKKNKNKNSNLQVTVQVRAPGVSPKAELRLFPITWGSREGWGLVWIQGRWAAFPPPSSSIQDRQASPASSRMTEGKSGTQQSLL